MSELYRPELNKYLLAMVSQPRVLSLLYDLDLLPEQLIAQKVMTVGLFAAYSRLEGVLLAFKFMELESESLAPVLPSADSAAVLKEGSSDNGL